MRIWNGRRQDFSADKGFLETGVHGHHQAAVPKIEWRVDDEQPVKIHWRLEGAATSYNSIGRWHSPRFWALPFRRNISVCFMHHIY